MFIIQLQRIFYMYFKVSRKFAYIAYSFIHVFFILLNLSKSESNFNRKNILFEAFQIID